MTHTQQAEQEGLDLGRGTESVERILHGEHVPIRSMSAIAAARAVVEDALEQAREKPAGLSGGIASISIADGAIAINPAAVPDRIAGTMVEVAGIALHPGVTTAAPPARRKRSDAGKSRPKPPAPVEAPQATAGGMLTGEQNNRLQILLEDVMQAERNYWAADQKRVKAGIAYNAYLDSLTVRP